MPTNPTRDEAVAWAVVVNGEPDYASVQKHYCESEASVYGCGPVVTVEPLYSAATVDALRGEVQRLREEVECERARTAGENERAQLLLDAKEHWRLKAAGMSGELERLRAFAEHARTVCFDFVNEGIRPWEHHMRDLAWRADGALNGDPTP